MKIRKYRAATVREALTKVKEDLGPDAIILKTQELPGLRRTDEAVEVTAAVDDVAPELPDLRPSPTAPAEPVSGGYDRRGRKPSPAEDSAAAVPVDARVLDSLRNELAALRAELRSARRAVLDGIPQGLEPAADWLAATGLDAAACRDLLAELALGCPIEEREPNALRSKLAEILALRIRVAPDLPGFPNRSGVVLLLGPTGVGKSTTIAKLVGAHLLAGGSSVGVITTDCYRMGAVEQMQAFAGTAEVPLETVFDVSDVDGALERLRKCSLVLVDTAGRSRTNPEHLEELQTLVQAFHPDQVHLVLSANTRDSDLRASLTTYAPCHPTHFLVTKLDETSERGCLAWLPGEGRLPISHVCFGQRIPDDLKPAEASWLARLVLGGED